MGVGAVAHEDRERWNARYNANDGEARDPAVGIPWAERSLPLTGRALDVAGGSGRHALWLANRGLDVTLLDVSDVALRLAGERAERLGLALETVRIDLETRPLPRGPWMLIVCCNYLQRSLFSAFAEVLVPGGLLVFSQPTRSNLARHPRPGARFLLEDGELPGLVLGLEVLDYWEGWSPEGRHEARLLARRPLGASPPSDEPAPRLT